MATRDAKEFLESGEVDDIKKGGTTPDDSLPDLAEVKAITDALDTRISDVEGGHSVVLQASSPLASQEPTALDTALQISYGVAQGSGSDPVMLSGLGAITFNTADKYIINFRAHYGRTGGAGTAVLLFRFLKNGIQVGDAFATKISDAETLVPWDSSSFIFEAQAGDVLTAEIVRDGAGNNSGGLFAVPATLGGWNGAKCASVGIYKV